MPRPGSAKPLLCPAPALPCQAPALLCPLRCPAQPLRCPCTALLCHSANHGDAMPSPGSAQSLLCPAQPLLCSVLCAALPQPLPCSLRSTLQCPALTRPVSAMRCPALAGAALLCLALPCSAPAMPNPLRCSALPCPLPCHAPRGMQRHVRKSCLEKQESVPLTSATLDSVLPHTVHGYARVHTSIYIYIYTYTSITIQPS